MSKLPQRIVLGAAFCAVLMASGLGFAASSSETRTKADLLEAMKGEAFATLKYMTYADAARAHGNAELAGLFELAAKTEREEHFAEHAKLYGLAGSDAENLKDAIKGESAEAAVMYPQMAKRAEEVGDREAAKHFREVAGDEANHRDAFQASLAQLGTN